MAQVPDSHRLFVGNLSSEVKKKHLQSFFEEFGDIESIQFPKKGARYCFVNFTTEKAARKAFKKKNNKKLGKHRIWCNIKLKHKKEEIKSHIVLEKNIPVNNIDDIDEIKTSLERKYASCGKVNEVFMPKHLVEDQRGVAFINFDTEEAVREALKKSPQANIHVPTYVARSPETIHGGGYGGMYGFETEDGKYIFEDSKH